MSKFNSPKTIRTTNNEGHVAYSMTDKSKLITQVLTSFFNEAKFYGDNSDDIRETLKRVAADDPHFVSNLAVFARREFNMRSISHILVTYLAHEPAGKPYVRSTVKGVTLRGDDATEIMSAYLSEFGKPIPNSLKKGIADVLKNFDEYTLAKYKGTGKEVKMSDLLNLCHPKPKNHEQELLWKRCLEGTLAVPETWETKLSANGNSKETWEELIANDSVGYMALLRNLRNIIKANPDNIDKVYAKLSDPIAVRKSKQLPFRFYSAYAAVRDAKLGSSKIYDVLEDAMDASVENLPKIPGKTLIAIDVSGSMGCPMSKLSSVTYSDVSTLLGIVANRVCEDAVVITFDDFVHEFDISHRDGILSAMAKRRRAGGGTNMNQPFCYMLDHHISVDRVIILSDNECNGGWWSAPVQVLADKYRIVSGNNIWVHAIDLAGYGTQQFHGAKTNVISGWSEKVFEFIPLAEQGIGSLEKTIENYSCDMGSLH